MTALDASEARNTAGPVSSSGFNHLLAGVLAQMNWSKGCLLPSGWISRRGAGSKAVTLNIVLAVLGADVLGQHL